MVCGYSRKEIPCEIPGICTLLYVNQDFTDISMHKMDLFCFVLSNVDGCVNWYTYEAIGEWFVDTLGKKFHVKLLGFAHCFM